MKMRTKALVLASLPFLMFFALGVTDFGQRALRGKLPPEIDHWKVDDIYMGVGLAPWLYGLVPFVLLGICALASWLLERRGVPEPGA